MLKKIVCIGLTGLALTAVWNSTRVVAASERVRDAWIASQRQQKLEDWDLHFKRQLRALQRKADAMERKARQEALAAEVSKMRSERAAQTVARSEALVAQFRARTEAGASGFVFAGQSYDAPLAAVQLKRFTGELEAVRKQAETAKARTAAHERAVAVYRKQAAQLRGRILELEERGRELAARKQALRAQQHVRELERRHAHCPRHEEPLDELRSLIDLAEETLDRIEAEQRIEQRARPARTLSLSESLEQEVSGSF